MNKLLKSEEEWSMELSPELYRIAREKGTERPFSGKYVTEKRDGIYICSCCGNPLFDSATKFDAHCGWPSFTAPISEAALETHEDRSHGMVRTEITCTKCGAHLGHVFDDGPGSTGERYCLNSVSLELKDRK